MSNIDNLKNKIAQVPDAPGVYLMKDKSGEIIYIGKAKSLKKRLQSYLGRGLSSKAIALLSNVADAEYRLCPNESLALLLEAELVRKYKPKYNVSLRDDKSFPLVKITDEEFPAVYITRKKEADASRYFGPYTNVKLLRQALKIIRRHFSYRSCKQLPKEACIYYRLKLSPAPCIGKISRAEYAKTIENISLILSGKTDALIRKLNSQMQQKAKQHKFEEAAVLRDKIIALGSLSANIHTPQGELEDLKNFLGLKQAPIKIEAFDVSNIFGREAVASMVSFYEARPDKNNYRRFRIKTVAGIDDYKMLKEAVGRRYARVISENLSFPDLVLIDGGKAHLSVAEKQIRELGLNIPLISIAKEKENIYIRGRKNPLRSPAERPALNLIRRIRDEAHRFALAYHHILRRKKIIGK